MTTYYEQWIDNTYYQWVDDGNYHQWLGLPQEITLSGLNQVYIDSNYVYAANQYGMYVYSVEFERLIATLAYDNGFNSLCGNDEKIYLATSDDGIKYVNKTCVSGSVDEHVDLSHCLIDYTDYAITSNKVRYLHCNNNFLACCTNTGVDVISFGNYRSYSSGNFDVYKCFISSVGKLYYTKVIDDYSNIDVVYDTSSNWSTYDYRWSTRSGIFQENSTINDIYVTEATATSGFNTLFVATTSGAYIIDEYNSDYEVFITDSDISAIWADVDACIGFGKFYASTINSLYVYDLSNHTLFDYYSETSSGRYGESLIASGIVDITISFI